MPERSSRPGGRGDRSPPTGESSDAELEAAALAYLERFDASAAALGQVLLRRARKRGVADLDAVRARIERILERYRSSGILNDRRYAATLAAGLRRRGCSRLAIRHKLRSKGIASDDIELVLGELDGDAPDPELEAAKALARRRRLGPYRQKQADPTQRRKDLAALARAGFSYETAVRALGPTDDDSF